MLVHVGFLLVVGESNNITLIEMVPARRRDGARNLPATHSTSVAPGTVLKEHQLITIGS